MTEKEITLVYDEETGMYKRHEPYMTLVIETEEDWEYLNAALEFYKEHKEGEEE